MEQEIKSFIDKGEKNKAIEIIYTNTVRNVYRYVYSRIGDRSWTEDIVSQTYETLVSIIENYDGSSKFSTFVIGIARNKILQFIDQKKLEAVPLDEDLIVIPNDASETSIVKKGLLEKIIKSLDPKEREILESRFLLNMSAKAIGEKLGLSQANVRVLQHRALKKCAQIGNKLLKNTNENKSK